ncbi:hypothetical protein [Streptomyces sp. NPDC058739]|uniref:hypothetical protein n=1 Tax=Streptomyces sp. NPDC058739 TaxID=3346618 RepID=UPI003692CFAD
MSTPSPTSACNHRALEVTAVLFFATTVALLVVCVAVVGGMPLLSAAGAGASALVLSFGAGIGAVTYVRHGG